MGSPIVSVVTVCRNAAETIGETVRSVIGQKGLAFEYIVVDGASTDGTLEALDRFRDRIDVLVSEPDNGMYEALNKAIRLSSGRYINLINGDDRYVSDDVLALVVPAFERGSDVIYGDLIYEDREKRKDFRPPRIMSREYLRHNCVTQQAIFYKREVFDKVGLFDESYKIVADYQWLIRAFKAKSVSFEHIDVPIAYFRIGGLSTGSAARARYRAERTRVRAEQFSKLEYLLDRTVRKARSLSSYIKR
jgi:glycosyltransferase involved in cell wall biosynthesis